MTSRRATAKSTSLVGRRKIGKTRKKAGRRHDDDPAESDDENDMLESTLPPYLQQRRAEQREEEAAGGEGALRMPPSPPDEPELQWRRDLAEKPQLPGLTAPEAHADRPTLDGIGSIPAPIAKFLKPYQVDGTEWLHRLFVTQKGGILGDDMGLGKTIQIIAFLTVAFGKTADERDAKRMRVFRNKYEDLWYPRVLIICPGTLMENWKNELDRWGWWHVYTYHGSAVEKDSALAAAASGRLEIMMTTYTTYTNSQDAINQIRWDCVIADECHSIKNHKSETSQAMNNVNALCRIGLTGTAIQNNYEELWVLLNWTNPGCVSSLASWKRRICVPLKLGQSHDATNSQLKKARDLAKKLVQNLLPRFFLRRTKALIAHQLPKKTDRVVFCPLTETQAQAYNNFVDHELVHAIRDSQEPCYCGSGKKQGWCCMAYVEGYGPWNMFVFPVLHTIQKLSNHLALMLPTGIADPEKHEKELDAMKIALPDLWKDLYQTRDNIKHKANAEFCGKWKVLKKLLKLWYDNGDKVLVFSHSVKLLTMLELLFRSTTTYNVSYLDGSLSYAARQEAVDEYNANPNQFVFLISTKAGGMGINVTSANKVVIMDPNWNPAYDLQAQDRAYRIGQTRDVEVFRLVSAGTVEEIVYARQIYKQQQAQIGYNASVERRYFKGVQGQAEHKGEIFGLKNLFAPLKTNVVLQDIVNKTNIAEARAGVEIAGLELESTPGDEDEFEAIGRAQRESTEAGISDLAAEILDEPSRKRKLQQDNAKKDAVKAILASAGVEYTHENAEVIGTSKWEAKISSRAQKAGNDLDYIDERAFAKATQDSQEAGFVYPQDDDDDDAIDLDDGLGKIRYKYRPPEDVRMRQFCTMAKMYGYEGKVSEFALVVEGWSQEERRDCLERFYKDRREILVKQRSK
ncbi:uncharacterized protein MYCFIDRAFT_203723, partial [Pseudocercospora fijiensis CIRAD86]